MLSRVASDPAVTDPPVIEISPSVNPDTASLNAAVTRIGEVLVGLVVDDDSISVGDIVSPFGVESHALPIPS